ncbi:YqaJ viral recombinase family protein [Rhodococcus globerulus]|uniref:YqaJ viral recombinase family protein n=1 Tax=Rhodococcus globerulus TaxID=33008 RepID=A0ABU4C3T5_RHOGO|nr:YqaJ viral recombinase family protein [Rhodococcus globerulus]MDV6271084.1 YqaJ viral recombinase family protein [Rhodococcus globerulus]
MTSREVAVKAAPGSPEWHAMVTPSKVPPILGISRWQSQFTAWHIAAGNLPPERIGDAKQDDFDYGHAAELAAAEYWKFKNPGWRLSRGEIQYTDDSLEFANAATIDRRASRGSLRRIVEVKTARSLEEWGDDGSGEVPADYAAQVIMQQRISGLTAPADVVLWPQYGKPRIYTIEYDPRIAAAILMAIRRWHTSLYIERPPALDDTVSTYESVRRLHPDIDEREVQLTSALAHEYLTTVAEEKDVAKRLTGVKSRVLDAMSGAKTAKTGELLIATRGPHGKGIALKSNTKADPAEIERLAA